jgi:hypothetical protein
MHKPLKAFPRTEAPFSILVGIQPLVIPWLAESPHFHRLAPQHFNRGVKELCDEGVFIRFKKDGKTELRLNPEHGWKGSAKNHVIALSEVRKTRERAVAKTT